MKAAKIPRTAAEKGSYPMEVPPELAKQFYDMIKSDEEMYLRILRYEVSFPFARGIGARPDHSGFIQPMSFDELVSKAIANGIKDVNWKGKLKRFLDLQVSLASSDRAKSETGNHVLHRRSYRPKAASLR